MDYKRMTDAELVLESTVDFARLHDDFQATGERVKAHLEALLEAAKIKFHFVTMRVKDPVSYEKKLAREPSRAPEDVVGVRVILYFQEDVIPVLTIVRQALDVDESTVVNKALLLRPREFGYRSVQVVGREWPPAPRGLSRIGTVSHV